jgi:CheY-like chemotaxis protein
MTLLFIDDDPEDAELFCEAVTFLNNSEYIAGRTEVTECHIVNNGRNVVEFLNGLKELPRYIFLDINMPMMGGRECLAFLKNQEKYARIPVIMFSTSFREKDVSEFKTLGAHDCIQKPAGFNALVKTLSRYVYGES